MPFYHGTELARVYRGAKAGGYGFVASNITHPDILAGLVTGAERAGSDLVVQVKRDTAEFLGGGDAAAGLRITGSYLDALAESRDIGVFLNVDHVEADDEALVEASVESGIPSSIMIDASARPFEENVERTRAVVERARARDMLVEAELGTIKGTEGGVETTEELYTDPEDAVEFVERTGCDLLAISIGTQHGVAKGRDLELRPDIARDVNRALLDHGLDVPLVLHGASGLHAAQLRDLLQTGVCKLNTNTRYQYEYARTAADYYREHEGAIRPPDGVADDREGFFADTDWAPDKSRFNPQVVSREIRARIADVAAELAELAGSAGRSRYA